MTPLLASVQALLADAAAAYAGTPAQARLTAAAGRLSWPLRVAIAGKVKAGKSTLLNALVGERLAATDAGECTRVVTEYVHGPAPRAWAHPYDGPARQVPYRHTSGAMLCDLGELPADTVERLRVEVPNAALERLTLIDTPGIASLSDEVSARTHDFLAGAGTDDARVDAVIYLMRHLHSSDVNFLEAFSDVEFRGTSPVNAIGVLSRADEIGAGRGDSLDVAGGIASRYAREPRVRALVQTVVPVAGLLGQTAADLREAQYATLAELAALPAADLIALVLSADRFAADVACPVPASERAALLAALGLYGVRVSIALIQRGQAPSGTALASELLRRSGLPQLQDLLGAAFLQRRDLLKAQGALRELSAVLAASPAAAGETLRRRQEQILASAHELTELRLLNDLRTGEVFDDWDDDAREAAERLLGATGSAACARLGLPAEAAAPDVRAAALAALRQWQQLSEDPSLSAADRRAAAEVRRTCEGLLASAPAAEATPARRRVIVG